MLTRVAGLLGILVAISCSAGCAAEPVEDSGDQADAISSEAAAAEWKGAVKVLEGHSTSAARALALGVKTWDVYLVKTASFQGIAYVGIGGDKHVKNAVLTGSTSSGEPALSIVNYDQAGKTGATERDTATLRALATDLDAVNLAAQKAILERRVEAANRAVEATTKAAEAAGRVAEASTKAADAYQRSADAYGCSADLISLTGGIVTAMALPAAVLVIGAPIAALGGALALLFTAMSVAGVGFTSYTVTDIAMSAIDKTRCFAR